MKYDYIIGIDPGVNTGIAVWDAVNRKLEAVGSMKIHEALEISSIYKHPKCFWRIEDARKRKWFGNNSAAKQQGAGSIKRDCKIWEDFLIDIGVDFEMIHPIKAGTKHLSKTFKELTGWTERTNEHSRDAAMLVFNYK